MHETWSFFISNSCKKTWGAERRHSYGRPLATLSLTTTLNVTDMGVRRGAKTGIPPPWKFGLWTKNF